jgi:lipopolysaccharide/colanic/teichoic acid biosynthesis glycosyltransferase
MRGSSRYGQRPFIKYRHEEKVLVASNGNPEDIYLTRILPDKLRMDLDYIQQQNFLFDLKVLVQAAISLFYSHSEPNQSKVKKVLTNFL